MKFPRVEVEWDDARVKGGWRGLKEYRSYGLVRCRAIGYVIRRDRKVLTLVQQIGLKREDDGEQDVSDGIIIPASCVKRIHRLVEK